MENEKRTKYFQVFVIAALVVSVIMNWSLLGKISDLEYQVDSVENYQYNNNINGELSHIQGVLNDLQQQGEWLSGIDMTVTSFSEDKMEATFEWQVKELEEDSQVVFHYSNGADAEYKAVPAEQIQKGLFRVNVPLDVVLEPYWEVYQTTSGENGVESEAFQEKPGFDSQALQFYVTVTDKNGKVKSGDIQSEYMDKYGMNKYGSIRSEIHIDEKYVTVNLDYFADSNPENIVDEVYLLKYQGDTFLGEEKLEYRNHDEWTRNFHLNQLKMYDNMRLALKVVYSNGQTFENEVLGHGAGK